MDKDLSQRDIELWCEGDHATNNNNNNDCRLRLNSKNIDASTDYLRSRFGDNRIYTEAASNVLLSINDGGGSENIHSEAFAKYFKFKRRFRDLPAHLYRVCRWCYRAAFEQGRNQCIVFMGEMGGGKTRCFDRALKFIVNYLAPTAPGPSQQLLNAQTMLKAFGGMRFKDNEEACRYAQLLEVELDFKGDLYGARISVLPLDRTSAIGRMPVNGGFSIFYALLLGADLHLLKSIRLQRNPNFYSYLKNDPSTHSSAVNVSAEYWRKQFTAIKAALAALKFTNAEVQDLFKLLAVILKLGNISFRACINVDGSVGCCSDNELEFIESTEVLGCKSKDDLKIALTKRSMVRVRGDLASVSSLPDAEEQEAERRRDAVCEALWCRLFYWLIGRMNQGLRELAAPSGGGSARRVRKVSLLDTAGFDAVREQKGHCLDKLLRNYAAERFFCQFATSEIQRRQQAYADEGLQWDPVLERMDFRHAAAQIESVLETSALNRNGPVSPECCHSPSGSNTVCNGEMLVNHFFGEVSYDLSKFDNENTQMVPWSVSKVFYNSSNQLAKLLFPAGDGETDSRHLDQNGIRKPLSVSGQFRTALTSMLKTLEDAACSYVICMKPNDKQRPNTFDTECVERQLKIFRVPSLVRLGAAGFAYVFTYDEFLERYKMLSPLTWPGWTGQSARSGATTILRHQQISPAHYALGREKVFLKSSDILSILEECRRRRLHYLASIIQRAYRRWLTRTDRRTVYGQSQAVIAAHFRSFVARKEFLRQRRAVVFAQARFRGWKARKEYASMRQHRLTNKMCLWLRKVVIARYLLNLARNLPSTSPLDNDWPDVAPMFCRAADDQLRELYHKWRCRKYRSAVDQQAYFRMREKLAASLVFKNKKSSYSPTVGHPFRGDYVRIRQNSKWRRVAAETGDEYVVFADLVSKLHRSSGKVSPELLIVSTNGIVVMDHRTVTLKYRALVGDLVKISVSPFADSVAVLHFKNNSLNRRSGDFVFECRHLVEAVAKLYLVVHNAMGKPPFVNVSSTIFIDTGSETTELLFHDRDTEKDERDDWTGCFVSTPVLPLKSTKTNAALRLMSDNTSCSSTSDGSGCSGSTAKLKLVKRGNRIDFYV